MRIGSNPEKINFDLVQKYYHRIIVPVYIPNLEGYFEELLDILKLSLTSIINTVHCKTAITVINNASCKVVSDYLQQEFDTGRIEQLIYNKENNGKVDPIISIVRGCYEPLITITDADVLFLPQWQKEIEKIHHVYPSAGMVGPVPNSKITLYATSSSWIFGQMKAKIRFEKVADPEGMLYFGQSISNEPYLTEGNLAQIPTITYKGQKACVGCGHFCATLKRGIFEYAPKGPSLKKIGGRSENDYIDKPNEKAGMLRLATVNNYAYHMGNKIESWMLEKTTFEPQNYKTLYSARDFKVKQPFIIRIVDYLHLSEKVYKLKNYGFKRLSKVSLFRVWYCQRLGLKKEYSSEYF